MALGEASPRVGLSSLHKSHFLWQSWEKEEAAKANWGDVLEGLEGSWQSGCGSQAG